MKSSKEFSSTLAFIVLIIGQHYAQSFSQVADGVVLFGNRNTRSRQTTTTLRSSSQNNEGLDASNNKNDKKTEEGSGLLPLPPFGESSFDPESFGGKQKYESGKSTTIALDSGKSTEVAMVGSAKFELQYTCNLCETKNSHKVSRLGK
jgi:hypothetical protein